MRFNLPPLSRTFLDCRCILRGLGKLLEMIIAVFDADDTPSRHGQLIQQMEENAEADKKPFPSLSRQRIPPTPFRPLRSI